MALRLGVLVIATVLFGQIEATEVKCSEDFTLLEGRCYRVEGDRAPLLTARKTCANLEAEVVTFETQAEYTIVTDWLKGKVPGVPRPKTSFDMWVNALCADWHGASRNTARKCPGGFSWASGDSLSDDDEMWMPDRPRPWLSGKAPPDGVVLWRYADWHMDNRPSVYKKGLALCEKAPENANVLIDVCALGEHNCDEQAVCTMKVDGGFTCTCNDGYQGDGVTCEDIDECSSSVCGKNAQCTNKDGGYQCTCNEGYQNDGQGCVDVDECSSTDSSCADDSTCSNTEGSFTCVCNPGYTGDGNTCADVDECLTGDNNCDSNAVCTNTDGAFTCSCKDGFQGNGMDCTDIDECASNQCVHGACVDGINGYTCDCGGTGFSGKYCETDIDDCANNPCGHGTCTDGVDSFTCDCTGTGFSGKTCDANIDECAGSPCAHGTCIDGINTHTCDCTDTGYKGNRCEINIDDCANNPCAHGTCRDGINGYTCDCAGTGYSGNNCQTNIDECASRPCVHGVCRDGVNKYTCDCTGTAYKGSRCEIALVNCGAHYASSCAECPQHGHGANWCNGQCSWIRGSCVVTPADGGWGFIESKSMPGKCVDVHGLPGTHNLANIQLYNCEYHMVPNQINKIDQLWKLDHNGHLISRPSRKCMDVFGWSARGNMKNIDLYTCEAPGTRNSDHFWEFRHHDNTWFTIRNKSTGKCLDVWGWSENHNHKNMQTWTCESWGQWGGGFFGIGRRPSDHWWKFVPLGSVAGFRGRVDA